MYWEKVDDVWMTNDFLGKRKVKPNEPVCHVSFYEADAYSKWAGKRLPTEAEWEKAACWDEKTKTKTIFPWGDKSPDTNKANLLESYLWNCTEIGAYPDSKSHCGCQQMIGDVWEWTSSEFTGYPGFKSGFSEYNDKWFANQKVLRGGSFGTPSNSIRGSYRNFFRLDERWLFSGFRCAEDI
jgi:formylglycine-generating enzyme required for sulfatase activity